MIKELQPLLCYSTDHYFRVYVKVYSSVSKANQSISNFKIIYSGENIGLEKTKKDIGPMWTW